MSKSSRHHAARRHTAAAKVQAGGTPQHLREKLTRLYHAHRLAEAQTLARELTQQYPQCGFAWKALGAALLESGEPEGACAPLERARQLNPKDAEIYNTLAKVAHKQGLPEQAVIHLKKALELNPGFEQAQVMLTKFLVDTACYGEAIVQIDRALARTPGDSTLKARKAHALSKSGQFGKGLALYEEILRSKPEDSAILSNIGSMYRSVGRFDEAEVALEKAHRLSPARVELYSNYLLAMHYNPAHSAEAIAQAHLKWDALFRPKTVERTHAQDRTPDRRLRIGMISAGFRIHPVGQMITSSMEALPRNEFELFAYTMSDQVDALTERMQRRADRWQSATHLDNGELAQRIRDDRIDILFDLCGHTEGNRLLAVAMEPAPLQIKWVGGQINTTGLSAMDYLLSDAVETPDGVDAQYSEKLIRLPDDYICYMPRGDVPEVGMLPAYKNGFITFGCFNNPAKINPVIIECWASILNKIPTSRLFLKGNQYDSAEFVGRTGGEFARHGVDPQRLIFEGHSPHHHLLNTYNRVDIALDPWPYSGGLTTCEAMLMGVPVITLPGPTFAGRHSATHLINAGLSELVVDNWERYEQLAIDLASDLESLSTIRRNLRRQLENSPVCDHRRFARNFSTAMRAVWQRYCEGKAPAALRIDQKGQAWFEGDEQPMQLQFPRGTAETGKDEDFQFNLEGKIITLDHGGLLLADKGFADLQVLGAFATIAFDPCSSLKNVEHLQKNSELHYYPHVALGNGEEGTLYACLDPEMSATLEPLPAMHQLPGTAAGTQILARLPVATLRLDDIQGLESIDWVLLDNLNDNLKILSNATQALRHSLLLQIRISFVPTHQGQTELNQISQWLSQHGFSFYRLNNLQHHSHFPERNDFLKKQATRLTTADAIFIPDSSRLEVLSDNQRLKLAFLLHTVYGIRDLTCALLSRVSKTLSEAYLIAEKFLPKPSETERSQVPDRAQCGSPATKQSVPLPSAPRMSEAEQSLFRQALSMASSYFEFGSGGSTVWAAREGLTVKGVESDAKWVDALRQQLGERCQVEAVDIGPTREWGYPASIEHSHKFSNYSHAIKKHNYPFDLILIDGRFRVACTVTAIQHILDHHQNPEDARIFIHDFWDRPAYHAVLAFLDTLERVDTAGLFKLKPGVRREELERMLDAYILQPA